MSSSDPQSNGQKRAKRGGIVNIGIARRTIKPDHNVSPAALWMIKAFGRVLYADLYEQMDVAHTTLHCNKDARFYKRNVFATSLAGDDTMHILENTLFPGDMKASCLNQATVDLMQKTVKKGKKAKRPALAAKTEAATARKKAAKK